MSTKPLSSYQLTAEIEQAFDGVVEATARFCDAVDTRKPRQWTLCDTSAPAQWLRQALEDMWYEDGQDGRATRNYIGVVLADDTTLELAMTLNERKDHFGTLVGQLRKQSASAVAELKVHLPRRHPAVEAPLEQRGLARLHLKQTWRRLPIAEAPLARLHLSWYTSGRSIKRLTVEQAQEKLAAFNNEAAHIRIQWQKLAALPSDEILAQVQHQAPVMRGNLFFKEPLADGHTRRALNMALPLIIPADHTDRLPLINTPPATPPTHRTRARREDTRIEDDPYIPSLRLYRYRSQ
ncbi:DNA replication terminus site-binding protein [Larsenimonas rhizosphaerae]|uniref:DNA replication terminus site-binding protein n=1 Tax=Larsenimonas rhizosphaerae TaxID=2944682 RepID=A0AA41ZEA5_9GAMM|nr:DNA replication terminus site-binding protein [Larsenimonas rhizosphaerae]MCX2523689.1 DNA replication terminus site-binding protein [Larsenimonas rhizosphaerae]